MKNYKQYFIDTKTWENKEKIKEIKGLLKASKKEIINLDEWDKKRKSYYLTNRQWELLKNNDIVNLKKLLKKQLEKEKIKLEEKKQKAVGEYEKIKSLIDIEKAIFNINWTKSRGVYGYQCACSSIVYYKNGQVKQYTGEKTSGCGYDKPSSALSYNLNATAKILLIKHGAKILKDEQKHFNFYACENMYFSYGVGLSSYATMFENMGYKVATIYHQNEDVTIIIEKGRKNG